MKPFSGQCSHFMGIKSENLREMSESQTPKPTYSFKCWAAKPADITDDQTLCFHINVQFLIKSREHKLFLIKILHCLNSLYKLGQIEYT